MSEITVDKGVPLPEKRKSYKGRPAKYPFSAMEVGDSFTVPLGTDTKRGLFVSYMRMTSATASHKKRNPGCNFTIRTIPDEGIVRVWRTA